MRTRPPAERANQQAQSRGHVRPTKVRWISSSGLSVSVHLLDAFVSIERVVALPHGRHATRRNPRIKALYSPRLDPTTA